jgi:hypothetical protein
MKPMAKKMPANRTNALPAVVEEALTNVDMPGIIKIGDWAPSGYGVDVTNFF